jgi:Amt family ammonium transporter
MSISKFSSTFARLCAASAALLAPAVAFAQEAAPAATAAAAPAFTMDKGDNTWMLVSSALVLLMTIPGLALFYGGLVRAKNMLSVLMQVCTTTLRLLLSIRQSRRCVVCSLSRVLHSIARISVSVTST